VARVTGKADRDYGFAREFVRGVADKANGLLRYSLEDLGGPGWAVARDRRRVTVLLELRELTYFEHGELATADVLRVVKAAGSWDGATCSDHGRPRAILEGVCSVCEEDRADRERIAAETATAPEEVPF
jgi:hypothetical protein